MERVGERVRGGIPRDAVGREIRGRRAGGARRQRRREGRGEEVLDGELRAGKRERHGVAVREHPGAVKGKQARQHGGQDRRVVHPCEQMR